MTNLIFVKTNPDGTQAVSARELYEFLQVRDDFSTWAKRMFEYGFFNGVDYIAEVFRDSAENPKTGGRPKIDYVLTLDCAKKISMLQRTERGKQARLYFISCEKKLKEIKVVKAPDNLYDALKLSLTLLEENLDLKEKLRLAEEETEMLEKKAAKFKSKAETLDILTDADRSISMGQMAKTLGFGRNKFMAFLRQIEYLDRQNVAYESRRKYFTVIQKKLKREKFQTVTLVNSVGIAHFGRMKLRGIFEELN